VTATSSFERQIQLLNEAIAVETNTLVRLKLMQVRLEVSRLIDAQALPTRGQYN
jgi:hypothetical protein